MSKILTSLTILFLLFSSSAWSQGPAATIGAGQQPQMSRDNAGTIRVVFGLADSIFCSTLRRNAATFSEPVFVGHIQDMHLGMTRGPQIASSSTHTIITAVDKAGNIHWFSLPNSGKGWQYKGTLNDSKGNAPEGLMSIAGDAKDNFYAVWLDIRKDKTNNICFAALPAKSTKWTPNKLIYISPGKHVCECCKPSISVSGARVAVMFRNWLNGSRDLYLATSANGGKKFGEAQKLGSGTWKLNACPMDGGSVSINSTGQVKTTWRREGAVYFCEPNSTEIKIADGRTSSIVAGNPGKTSLIAWQDKENVKIGGPGKSETVVGRGGYLTAINTGNNQILCVWEQDKTILYKTVPVPSAEVASN